MNKKIKELIRATICAYMGFGLASIIWRLTGLNKSLDTVYYFLAPFGLIYSYILLIKSYKLVK